MSEFPSLENRSLKRKEYFPPDVYLQKVDQKEDFMSEDLVKDGYKCLRIVRDEYHSCKEESRLLNLELVWSFACNFMSNRHECSNIIDAKRKLLTNMRDTVIPAIEKNRDQVSDWFKELAGNVPLNNLGRRVPFFKEKEESIHELLLNNVPISRAIWFINMSIIQSSAVAENAKKKPRAHSDPTSEWTTTLCRVLSQKLSTFVHNYKNGDIDTYFPHWDYLFDLLVSMYDVDLADHWEVLLWLIKTAEETHKNIRPHTPCDVKKSPSSCDSNSSKTYDFILKFLVHYLIRFGYRFTESELITRRLLYWCCMVFTETLIMCTGSQPLFNASTIQGILNDYKDLYACSLHRIICMSLAGLVAFLVLSCPSAAVWNALALETEHIYFKGSPLDLIPHTLVALPLPPGDETIAIRSCLFDTEELIIKRSKFMESGWLPDFVAHSNGENADRLVHLLDMLDRYEYHVIREPNPMELLFNRIFNDDSVYCDTACIVTTLCEWAVSTYRTGIYRAIVVACLLEQLNNTFLPNSNERLLLQNTFIQFLDSYTVHLPPFNGEQSMVDNEMMRNMVCLFSELIDREVFDHDYYVRYFIARGVFDTTFHPLAIEASSSLSTNLNMCNNNNGSMQLSNSRINTPNNMQRSAHSVCSTNAVSTATTSTTPATVSVTNTSTPTTTITNTNNNALSINNTINNTNQLSVKSEVSEDLDRFSIDNPDSVRSEFGNCQLIMNSSTIVQRLSSNQSINHFHYLVQFPLPQDESYLNEQNQRFQLLYGVVRARDRARYRIRKLVRDICKLFTKKIYLIDVVHGEVCRRKKSKERDRDKETGGTNSTSTNQSNLNVNNNSTNTANTSTNTNNNNSNSTSGPSAGHRVTDDTRTTEELHEDIMQRFMSLSFYDMECVLTQCTPVFVKVLGGSNSHGGITSSNAEDSVMNVNPIGTGAFGIGGSNLIGAAQSPSSGLLNGPSTAGTPSHIYMPVPSSIFLFFDLIEASLNITSLILTVVDTLERLRVLFETHTQFMSLYMSYLCLRSVGILQRYQAVLFTMGDNILTRLFPTLIEQVRQVKEPSQCGLFERCILAYLNDLFTVNCVIQQCFNSIYSKAHQKVSALFRSADRSEGKAQFDPDYATDLLLASSADNLSIFRAYAEDLRLKPSSRYSFVCKAIIWICQAKTTERVNYLCGLCAELTAQCNDLIPEWLGSFYAILAQRPYLLGYLHLINVIDPADTSIYDNLSSLIGSLLSHYCLTICDFLRLVICPAMVLGLDNVTQPVSPCLEPIIFLACHILHRLFTAESSIGSLQSTNVLTPNLEFNTTTSTTTTTATATNNASSDSNPPFRVSEPLLLTSALQKVTPEYLVDVLKVLILHFDKASLNQDANLNLDGVENTEDDSKDRGAGNQFTDVDSDDDDAGEDEDDMDNEDGKSSLNNRKRNQFQSHKRKRKRARKNPNQVHYVVQRFLEQSILPSTVELRNLPLSAFIQLVLREICTLPWVRELFQQMSIQKLVRENVLIDKNFSQSQARRLLHIIYWPNDLSWVDIASTNEGLAGAMCHVLSDLNMWTLRSVQMEFQLLYAQITFSQQSEILGYLAQSIVQGFQTQAINWLNSNGCGLFSDGSISSSVEGLPNFHINQNDPVWLLPSLVAKLPKTLKSQLVRFTFETLKGIRHFWKHKNDEDKESVLLQNSIILAHPAFFTLLQVCLQESDPIDSSFEQIEYFVQNARETEDRVPDNLRTRHIVQECLKLRLILVGQKFHLIQTDSDISTRWAVLLAQLIVHGVTEPESNLSLFNMVYDMLQCLIHTLASRTGIEGKHYLNVAKKIRRELIERPSNSGIECIKPLLLLTKTAYTVFLTGHCYHRSNTSGSAGGSIVGGSVGKLMHSNNSKGSGKLSGNSSNTAAAINSSGSVAGNLNNSASFNFNSLIKNNTARKRGYQVMGKERLLPWDIYDPSKQTVLLSVYGALRTDPILTRVEEQANRMIRHGHFEKLHRPIEFYMKPAFNEIDYNINSSSLVGDECLSESKQFNDSLNNPYELLCNNNNNSSSNVDISNNPHNANTPMNINRGSGNSTISNLNTSVTTSTTPASATNTTTTAVNNVTTSSSINQTGVDLAASNNDNTPSMNKNIQQQYIKNQNNVNLKQSSQFTMNNIPPYHHHHQQQQQTLNYPGSIYGSDLNVSPNRSNLTKQPQQLSMYGNKLVDLNNQTISSTNSMMNSAGAGATNIINSTSNNSENGRLLNEDVAMGSKLAAQHLCKTNATHGINSSNSNNNSANSVTNINNLQQQSNQQHNSNNYRMSNNQLMNMTPHNSAPNSMMRSAQVLNLPPDNETGPMASAVGVGSMMNNLNYANSSSNQSDLHRLNMNKFPKYIPSNMEFNSNSTGNSNSRLMSMNNSSVSSTISGDLVSNQGPLINPIGAGMPNIPSCTTVTNNASSTGTTGIGAHNNANTATNNTSTTKRKRGSGRRGGGSQRGSGRNAQNERLANSSNSANTNTINTSSNSNSDLMNPYLYNTNTNSIPHVSDISVNQNNAAWSNKANMYNMNSNDSLHPGATTIATTVSALPISVMNTNRGQGHLANLSGFLRNRFQQQQQQQHSSVISPSQNLSNSHGHQPYSAQIPATMINSQPPHQLNPGFDSLHGVGANNDAAILAGQFNPQTSMGDNSGTLRRPPSMNLPQSMGHQASPHMIIRPNYSQNMNNNSNLIMHPSQHPSINPSHHHQIAPPNPPPYPVPPQVQHQFRTIDNNSYIVVANESGDQYKHGNNTLDINMLDPSGNPNPNMNTTHSNQRIQSYDNPSIQLATDTHMFTPSHQTQELQTRLASVNRGLHSQLNMNRPDQSNVPGTVANLQYPSRYST